MPTQHRHDYNHKIMREWCEIGRHLCVLVVRWQGWPISLLVWLAFGLKYSSAVTDLLFITGHDIWVTIACCNAETHINHTQTWIASLARIPRLGKCYLYTINITMNFHRFTQQMNVIYILWLRLIIRIKMTNYLSIISVIGDTGKCTYPIVSSHMLLCNAQERLQWCFTAYRISKA